MQRQLVKCFLVPAVVVLTLIVASLACGGTEEAEKIGEAPTAEPSRPTATSTIEAEQPPEEPPPAPEEVAPTDTPEPLGPTAYQVGDIISIGDTVMVVLGWDSPPGDEFSKPDEGNKFVVVDLVFVNHGEDSTSISTMLQMNLKDDTAQMYGIDLMAQVASGGTSPDGEIVPGEKIRGQVGFQVPQDAQGLVFVFDADVFGYGKAFIALQ